MLELEDLIQPAVIDEFVEWKQQLTWRERVRLKVALSLGALALRLAPEELFEVTISTAIETYINDKVPWSEGPE